MARKRKVAPNPEMLKLLERKKRQDAEFERELRELETARQERWVAVGKIAEDAGIVGFGDEELHLAFARIAQQKALQKAA